MTRPFVSGATNARTGRKGFAFCVVVSYLLAVAVVVPTLADWAMHIPVLGRPLLTIVPVEAFQVVLTLAVVVSAAIFSKFLGARRLGTARSASHNRIAVFILVCWESLTIVVTVAFVLEATNLWVPFTYHVRDFDPSTGSIYMRGLDPKLWPMPCLWAGSLAMCVAINWSRLWRTTACTDFPVSWPLLSAVVSVVVVASLALHVHCIGSAASLYTSFAVSELVGLLVLFSSVGAGILCLASGASSDDRTLEDKSG